MSLTEPMKILVTTEKVEWGMPVEEVENFATEASCSIPYTMQGANEVCRYVKHHDDIPIFVTPLFAEDDGLVSLKGFFEYGDNLENYYKVLNSIKEKFGEPRHCFKEEKDEYGDLKCCPCNIWPLEKEIIEVGIHEEHFVQSGYILITSKPHYKLVYTEHYIDHIGCDPADL